MQKKKKEAFPPPARQQQTLIQKSQVSNPKLNEDMEKILNSIVVEIRKCPAQPRRKYQKQSDYQSRMKLYERPHTPTNNGLTKPKIQTNQESLKPLRTHTIISAEQKKRLLLLFEDKNNKPKSAQQTTIVNKQDNTIIKATNGLHSTDYSQIQVSINKQEESNTKEKPKLASQDNKQLLRNDSQSDKKSAANEQIGSIITNKRDKALSKPNQEKLSVKRHIGEDMIAKIINLEDQESAEFVNIQNKQQSNIQPLSETCPQ